MTEWRRLTSLPPLLLLVSVLCSTSFAAADTPVLANGDFEDGFRVVGASDIEVANADTAAMSYVRSGRRVFVSGHQGHRPDGRRRTGASPVATPGGNAVCRSALFGLCGPQILDLTASTNLAIL